MYYFINDYNEIMHEKILDAITKNNMVQTKGYGDDKFCDEAKELIKKSFCCPNSDVYFFMAGTQTNLTIIDAMLTRSFEAVIAVDTAHINVHEGGAIEASGHKIMDCPNENGKLNPKYIEKIMEVNLKDDHMSLPKAVYISNSTELGSIYKLDELKAIWEMCKKYDLYLFLDGARLGSALCSDKNDIKKEVLAKYTDVFYIGGTKNGAPMGEAVVINNDALKKEFTRQMKCRGSISAKSKIIGISFAELFRDNLYFELAKYANDLAIKIYGKLKSKYKFYSDVESNQIFMEISNAQIEKLKQSFAVEVPYALDEKTSVIRIVTSWATDAKKVDELIELLLNM